MSSVDFGWRRFNFFDKSIIQDPQKIDDKFLGLKDVSVRCWCTGGSHVYLGESQGGIFRMSNHLNILFWKAYQHALGDVNMVSPYLFSIGEDDSSGESILKLWNCESASNEPTLLKSVRLSQVSPSINCVATSITVHSLLSDIAIGFTDGSVILYQGDVIRDRASRWVRIRESSILEGCVSGLGLAHIPGDRCILFTVTTKAVLSYVIENKTASNKIKHDASGVSKDCFCFDERLGQLIVGSKEMVYIYDAEQCLDAENVPGRCYQLGRGHEKSQIVSSDHHVVLVTKQHSLIPSANTEFMSMVTVYDVKGQYIAFSCSLPSLCSVFTLGDSIMILAQDGTLSELSEKNLNAKLDILYKKNLFDVAVGLARSCKDGNELLGSIYSKYGDYLYSKGDFDNAISQYKQTIGFVQPSYVIKRFHDESRLPQLCVYLEALHAVGSQNGHHTTILLHCYARMNAKKKMLSFIGNTKHIPEADLSVAFQVLRSCNMPNEASILAMKMGRHDEAVSILVEDLKMLPRALKYISQRSPDETCKYLEKYGRALLAACPTETMDILLVLIQGNSDQFTLSKLISIFMGDIENTTKFIEYIIDKVDPAVQKELDSVILELRLRSLKGRILKDDDFDKYICRFVNADQLDRCLQLTQLFPSSQLTELILKKLNRWNDLLQLYMKENRLQDMIDLCRSEHGCEKMWLDILVYVSQTSHPINEDTIIKMMNTIDETSSVHPLMVLDILSKSPTLKVSVVKDFVINWLTKQEAQIDNDNKNIAESERRINEIEKNIESLKLNVQNFQVNKCCACDTALHLPAVTFLCKHSYHVHCFESYADQTENCPVCNVELKNKKASNSFVNDRSSYSHFQKELNNSNTNNMELIAKYVKMGVFDAPSGNTVNARNPIISSAKVMPSLSISLNPFEDASSDSVEDSLNPFLPAAATTRPANARGSFSSQQGGRRNTIVKPVKKVVEAKNPFEGSTNPFDD